MSKRGASVTVRPTSGAEEVSADDTLVRTLTDLRDDLVSTLFFLLGSTDDAQEAAQETFLKCWRARASLPTIRDLRAWIFRIGLNTAKDLQRSAWHRRARPLMGEHAMLIGREAAPTELVEHQEALERLRRAILDLREEEKEVFLLRQNGDLTYEQIAELHQSPVGTVKTQMRSALHKLRKVLA